MENHTPESAPPEHIRTTIQTVARRQWWLWSSGVLVTLLLTLGLASFAFPGLLSQGSEVYTLNLNLAVRGLVGLVLLFNIYTIYQQLQIHRIQSALKSQIGAFDRLESRTEQVYKIAALDCLTGLYNRQSGEQRLTEEVARAHRHSRPLAILMLDLNRLKQTNDTFGHHAGDAMLRHFAERLQSAVRGSDVPIRLGGDEFLVLLPECKSSEIQLVLNRLRDISFEFEGHQVPIEFAAGWTDYIAGESSKEMVMRADNALYANKRELAKKREENATEAVAEAGLSVHADLQSAEALATLTPREREVLGRLALGKSNKEVAADLNISVRSVETHRANIMSHLKVHSTGELIVFALRNKIAEQDAGATQSH
jgi:diguanylate cyclase (GGDEF)-like protein